MDPKLFDSDGSAQDEADRMRGWLYPHPVQIGEGWIVQARDPDTGRTFTLCNDGYMHSF